MARGSKMLPPQRPAPTGWAGELADAQEVARLARVAEAEASAAHDDAWRAANAQKLAPIEQRLAAEHDAINATFGEEQEFALRMNVQRVDLNTERRKLEAQLVPPLYKAKRGPLRR
jgi:hypothetical protein